MVRAWLLGLVLVFLGGCSRADAGMEKAMSLRQQLLSGNGCSFRSCITADYGQTLYEFTMDCQVDAGGTLSFSVVAPDAISGIMGVVSARGGKLTFDGVALAFDAMAEDRISPVTAPWVFVNTLRSGYLTACSPEDSGMRMIIDDSYEEDALRLEILLDENDLPQYAEIYYDGLRILSLSIEEFAIL